MIRFTILGWLTIAVCAGAMAQEDKVGKAKDGC